MGMANNDGTWDSKASGDFRPGGLGLHGNGLTPRNDLTPKENKDNVVPKTVRTFPSDAMHDSGQRREFCTGAVRDAAIGKSRPDLISPFVIHREGVWMQKGAEKYTERNWEKGIPFSTCIASLFRHLNAYQRGERGACYEDHLAAIRANTAFLMHYEEMIIAGVLPSELNDLPTYHS